MTAPFSTGIKCRPVWMACKWDISFLRSLKLKFLFANWKQIRLWSTLSPLVLSTICNVNAEKFKIVIDFLKIHGRPTISKTYWTNTIKACLNLIWCRGVAILFKMRGAWRMGDEGGRLTETRNDGPIFLGWAGAVLMTVGAQTPLAT